MTDQGISHRPCEEAGAASLAQGCTGCLEVIVEVVSQGVKVRSVAMVGAGMPTMNDSRGRWMATSILAQQQQEALHPVAAGGHP